MLTQKYRPRCFGEVEGATVPVSVLSSIASNPRKAPRSIILQGGYGTGKTSCARIFGKALNCTGRMGDCCNSCPHCKDNSFYMELDSAMVGNVESMRTMRDTFAYSLEKGYRTVVFDEAQLVSQVGQSALLTVLEEATKGVFFVMCTTDPDKLLDTIKSRSLILDFELLSDQEILNLVRKVAVNEKIFMSPETEKVIVRRVRGHARDSLQQLEKLKIVGEETYLKDMVTLDDLFEDTFLSLREERWEDYRGFVQRILEYPLSYVDQDFGFFMMKIADDCFLYGNSQDMRDKDLVSMYLRNHMYLVSTQDWHMWFMMLADVFRKKKRSISPKETTFRDPVNMRKE